MAHRAGRRAKTFTTALGETPLERAWHQCDACGHGFAPRDRELGFGNGAPSPAVLRMVGMAAARVSFASASGLLRDLAGLDFVRGSAEETTVRHLVIHWAGLEEAFPTDVYTTSLEDTFLAMEAAVPLFASRTQGAYHSQTAGGARSRPNTRSP